jgi:hypothetical protein
MLEMPESCDEVIALADDGSVWIWVEGCEPPWNKLPALPQD